MSPAPPRVVAVSTTSPRQELLVASRIDSGSSCHGSKKKKDWNSSRHIIIEDVLLVEIGEQIVSVFAQTHLFVDTLSTHARSPIAHFRPITEQNHQHPKMTYGPICCAF